VSFYGNDVMASAVMQSPVSPGNLLTYFPLCLYFLPWITVSSCMMMMLLLL